MRAKAMPGEDPATLAAPDDLIPLFFEILSDQQVQTGEIFSYSS
jgi:hypothetical protein